MLATTYPGGALALLSALLWLILSIVSPIALLMGGIAICIRRGWWFWGVKSLRIAMWTASFAVLAIAIETGAMAWDSFFVLHNKKYFTNYFPGNFSRVAINLVSLLFSWLAYQVWNRNKKAATHEDDL